MVPKTTAERMRAYRKRKFERDPDNNKKNKEKCKKYHAKLSVI